MSTPTLLVDVHNKPTDLFRTVKQRIEACRAKCKCQKENQEPDAMPYQKLERMGARGREMPSYQRRELAAGSADEYGYMFCYEDFWFGDDNFGAGCGCENYPGSPPERQANHKYPYDGNNDCGAKWDDQITGYTFKDKDGLTGDEKFVGYADQSKMRNGVNHVHYYCDEPISNGSAGFGTYESSKSGPGRQKGFGPGADHRLPDKYIRGSGSTLGFYTREDSVDAEIQDTMVWHNYIAFRKQRAAWYSTFGSRQMTGAYIGHKDLEPSPTALDLGFVEWCGSYYLYSAEEYIGRIVSNINSGGSYGPPQFYVFTFSGRDKDGGYSPTQKRVFTIGDKVRLAVDPLCAPGPAGSLGTEWVGTIVDLAYGTFNMDVCHEPDCQGVCVAAYHRGDIPGGTEENPCPDIGPQPDCSGRSVDEWVGKSAKPKTDPNDLLPPTEWPVLNEGDGWENESCDPNVFTITGFRYTVQYSKWIPQRISESTSDAYSPLLFQSTVGGTMYHAFKDNGGSIDNLPKHKLRWDWPVNNSLDQWVCKDGEGNIRDFASSIIEEMNHWQSEPGGMVYWGGHGGKAYFTLECEDFRYDTDPVNQQPEWFETSGFANYSPTAPYFAVENNYGFPHIDSEPFLAYEGCDPYEMAHKGPFVQVEGPRNAYNWNRERCGAPELYWQARFYEFDCTSGKISRVTGTHQENILCNCDMSYGQIPWFEITGKAAPDWWPWKEAWMAGTEAIWECNETNTKAYAISGGRIDSQTEKWIPAKVYSWAVDPNLLREGRYEEFAESCLLKNAPEGGLTTVEVPGDETTYPHDMAWNEERPWRQPAKWGYWYWDSRWVPPK